MASALHRLPPLLNIVGARSGEQVDEDAGHKGPPCYREATAPPQG